MSAPQPVAAWFAAYAACHRHPANALIHWLGVPVIFAALLGLAWSAPVPEAWQEAAPWFNWVLLVIAAASIFYVRLSPAVSAGVLLFMGVAYAGIAMLDFAGAWPVWKCSLVGLVVAGSARWFGDRLEAQRPSLRQRLEFPLLAPAWLVGSLYQKIGQRF